MRSIGTTAAFATSLATTLAATAGSNTIGVLLNEPETTDGYVLFNQLQNRTTYLIDNEGRIINTWESAYVPGNTQYLLDDGDLLRTGDPGGNGTFLAGGDAGVIERFNWDGTLEWQWFYSDTMHRAHHDIAPMPNGNILVIAWEFRSNAEAIAAGRDPSLLTQAGGVLWPETIAEVEPVGTDSANIVWEWRMWDHLIQDFDDTKDNFGVVADHPELLDINHVLDGRADWAHSNAIDYNAELDQVLLNSPFLGEIWIIDHSTTTAEAAGHTGGNSGRGGDFLYRWGNPEAYGAGSSTDRRTFNHHDAAWIKPGLPGAGNIMFFNNGPGRPLGTYSTIDEFTTPVDMNGNYPLAPGSAYGPSSLVWTYEADPPTSLVSTFLSGARRQPNGNTLICAGAIGQFFEVRGSDDATVWSYVNPVTSSGPLVQGAIPGANVAFRAERYPPDFAGFTGRDLTPGRLVEIYPGDVTGDGIVNFDDILVLLSSWGPCPPDPCYADLDGSTTVDFGDLLAVLATWS